MSICYISLLSRHHAISCIYYKEATLFLFFKARLNIFKITWLTSNRAGIKLRSVCFKVFPLYHYKLCMSVANLGTRNRRLLFEHELYVQYFWQLLSTVISICLYLQRETPIWVPFHGNQPSDRARWLQQRQEQSPPNTCLSAAGLPRAELAKRLGSRLSALMGRKVRFLWGNLREKSEHFPHQRRVVCFLGGGGAYVYIHMCTVRRNV